MVDNPCICCGAELSGRYTHPRPVMNSMCECCTREVNRVQLALRVFKQQSRPAVIH
jgi:hypothetical protein